MPLALRCFLLGITGGLLAAAPPHAQAQARYPLPDAPAETPVALLFGTGRGAATYLVTERAVWRLEGRRFVRRCEAPAAVRCATLGAADSVLWLGTAQGLFCLNARRGHPRPVALPETDAAPRITTLFREHGPAGAVWAGAAGYGAFRQAGAGPFQKELSVPTVNTGAATAADSAVWLGTNIGLYCRRRGQWTRYNEEGVANREIPDNLVEKLLPDRAGHLWVAMSEGLSVLATGPAGPADSHLPTVKYLARPGNEVRGVAHVPDSGYLFATALGLFLLPDTPQGALENLAPATDKIAAPQLLRPVPTDGIGLPFVLEADRKNRLWLASRGQVTVLTANALRRMAPAGR